MDEGRLARSRVGVRRVATGDASRALRVSAPLLFVIFV